MSCEDCPLKPACEAIVEAEFIIHAASIAAAREKLRDEREKLLPYLIEDSGDPILNETVVALDALNTVGRKIISSAEKMGPRITRKDMAFDEALCDGPLYSRKFLFYKKGPVACRSKRRNELTQNEDPSA